MNIIHLTPYDLGFASLLVLLLAGTSLWMQLGITQTLLVAAVRTTVQLTLIGFVLTTLFAASQWYWVLLLALVMLLIASREVVARQKYKLKGLWGFGVGTSSMFLSTFVITTLVLILIIGNHPWYQPQYAIPLMGMMLGNTMTGIALGMSTLSQASVQQRKIIEARLMLGETRLQAMREITHDAMRTGMIPIINSMMVVGLVSLPGMMTGQLLAGVEPAQAVKYQIVIMFLIASATALGTVAVVVLSFLRLFTVDHQFNNRRIDPIRRDQN